MREVSCKATGTIIEVLDDAGVAIDASVVGLRTSVAELRDPSARVDWDVFAEWLARIERVCGDRLPPEEIGARLLAVPSFEVLRRAGQLLVSPRQLHEFATRLIAPALFPNVLVRNEWLSSGRLVVTGELLSGYRESPAFFRLCHGNVAMATRVLGLPPSIIEEQVITGRSGRIVLHPPPSHTLAARITRSVRVMVSLGEVWRGVARQQHELEASLAALRTSRHEQQMLIERLPDGVIIHRDGIVRWANTALLEILGVGSQEDVVGRTVLELAPPEDREAIAKAMRSAAPSEVTEARMEYRMVRPDGTHRRVQAGTTRLIDFEGAKARLTILRDVTEHHRLREHAAISERLASIGSLAAGVAHEINNPLAYVRLSLDLVAREVEALDPTRERGELDASLERAREGTDRVLAIVCDLKSLSRVHDDPIDAVDLPEVLDATLALAEPAIDARVRIERSYGPTPRARGARGRLGQVFLNLLTNAADAIQDGGPTAQVLRVSTHTDETGRAVVEITDSGVGIPPHVVQRVFEPFFTTKAAGKGTGLGLAICHRLIAELGGEITFSSRPGATTFRVVLPAAPAQQLEARDSRNTTAASRARGRVLVVDDERALLVALERMLGDAHEIVTATGGREALEILRTQRVDAILADVVMPDITGVELYEAIRSLRPGLERRMVFMTGGVLTPDVDTFLSAIPNRCLDKPFRRDELFAVLDELVLASRSSRGDVRETENVARGR